MCVACFVLALACVVVFFFQAEDGIRDLVRSRGLGDVYKRQRLPTRNRRSSLPASGAMATVLYSLSERLEASLAAVSYTHLTLPTSDLV